MKNYAQSGDTVTVTAPRNLASGEGCLVGSLFGVATSAALSGADVEIKREGIFTLTTLGTDTGAAGTKVYWDNTNFRLTVTPTGNTLVGVLAVAKTSGPTVASALLDGCVR